VVEASPIGNFRPDSKYKVFAVMRLASTLLQIMHVPTMIKSMQTSETERALIAASTTGLEADLRNRQWKEELISFPDTIPPTKQATGMYARSEALHTLRPQLLQLFLSPANAVGSAKSAISAQMAT
jgi:hypothetical protein